MKFQIRNIGNVDYGELDISKPLTIFCGPNNTGKTYVSYLINALLKPHYYLDDIDVIDFSSVLTNNELDFELNPEQLIKFRTGKIKQVYNNVKSIFGISDSDKLTLFHNFSLVYNQSDDIFIESVRSQEFESIFQWDGLEVRITKESGKQSITIKKVKGSSIPADDHYLFSWQLMLFIYDRIVNYPFVRPCIFPVERNSIYTFSKELSIQRNELIDQMQALKDNKKIGYESVDRLLGRSTRYPLAIRDCLSVANDLSNLQKNASEYYNFAESMEQSLLNGKLSVTKEGEMQFIPKKGQRLPIQLSASIVKTLSSLTFYLKHLACRGDLIIIDEPEMNLHPDAQLVLVRLFAKMINNGLNLLVSTHSDYIIRELNNLITLGTIKSKGINTSDLGYYDDEHLEYRDVDVYLFKPKRKRSRMSEIIKLSVKEDGFSVETIDDVINQLNVDSDKLTYKLYSDEYQD